MKPTPLLTELVVGLFLLIQPHQASSAEETVAWQVKPDPLPWKIEPPSRTETLAIPTFSSVNFPTTQSPYFALVIKGKNKAPNELRMYDLRTMSPIGSAVKANTQETNNIRVSPWGDHFAVVDKGDKAKILVWTVGKEKIVSSVLVSEDKEKIEALDFAGKNQIITLREIRENNRNVRYWQIWDLLTGKEVLRFRHDEEYSPKWTSFTPGRRYLVMQHTERGYHVLFFDLMTGNLAGKIQQQEANAPWGQCGHISVSPDGKEAALIWRIKKDGILAKIQRFDLVEGKKIGELVMKDELSPSEMGLLAGGMKTFQFLPDGRGWLVSGHQIVERRTGAIVYVLQPSPKYGGATVDRRFVDGYHVTDFDKDRKSIKILTLPKAELDAGFAKAAK
jgi:WD40 repeat protein